MRLVQGLPAGVSALLFSSAARLRALEGRLAAELEAAGFREAILPVVDYFAPYEPLLPPGARAELYRFADRDGELLALRSDFTPLLARLLAPHLAALELPLRLAYRGDVVRCPERGARRETEVYQLGGELLGRPEEAAELEREAAVVFARLLELAAPGRARLVLGLAGALDELLVAAAGGGAPELARAVARRELAAARGAGTALAEVVERGAPADGGALGARGAAALERLRRIAADAAAAAPGVAVAVDLAEFADFSPLAAEGRARDLRPYYEGPVFRAYLPGRARPVAGGGRYDRLFHALGTPASAIGFSLQLEALAAPEEAGR